MKAEANAYLCGDDSWYAKSPPTWAFPQPSPRALRTFLTDDDFENLGLKVLSKVERFDVVDLLDRRFDPERTGRNAQWLVRGLANDEAAETEAVGTRNDPVWIAVVLGRIDDLRDMAGDEGLDFDEVSATAALTFLRRLPSVRQPGTFLVGGNIRFVWDTAAGEQIGLQFRGGDKVQFVILQTDGRELGSTMGIRSHDALLGMLAAPDLCAILNQ